MSKSLLFITLGTRDIQFRIKEIKASNTFELSISRQNEWSLYCQPGHFNLPVIKSELKGKNGWVYPEFAREAGKILEKHAGYFNAIISFPVIGHILDEIFRAETNKMDIYIVVTDQKELEFMENKKEHWLRDTINYFPLLKSWLQNHYLNKINKIICLPVSENVIDIDSQYDFFGKKCIKIFRESEKFDSVIVLPQGGIDQINHALVLQLIQAFGTKVKLKQQPETEKPVLNIRFPFLFINDLNKHKVKKHLDDYAFNLITKDLFPDDNKVSYDLSRYATLRLSLNHDKCPDTVKNIKDKIDSGLMQKIELQTSHDPVRIEEEKVRDLFIAAKICARQQAWGDFLWRIFTLAENIYKLEVEKVLPIKLSTLKDGHLSQINRSENRKFENWLKEYDSGLFAFLKSPYIFHYFKINLQLGNPENRLLCQAIFHYLLKTKKTVHSASVKKCYFRLFIEVEKLCNERNKLAHRLKFVDKTTIEKTMDKNYSISRLIADFDIVLGVKGFGIYDEIKSELLRQLES